MEQRDFRGMWNTNGKCFSIVIFYMMTKEELLMTLVMFEEDWYSKD